MKISLFVPPRLDADTFAVDLASKYQVKLIKDPMREACKKYGFQTLYDMPLNLQLKVREGVLRAHCSYLEKGEGAIFNFCPCLWLADWMRWAWSTVPAEKWEEMLALARGCIKHYDQIIVLSGQAVAPYDGYVWQDKDNSEQVSMLGRFLLSSLDESGRGKNISIA